MDPKVTDYVGADRPITDSVSTFFSGPEFFGTRLTSLIRTELGRRRLCYSGVQAYNQLPISTNPRGFRFRLRRHLLRVQHDSV